MQDRRRRRERTIIIYNNKLMKAQRKRAKSLCVFVLHFFPLQSKHTACYTASTTSRRPIYVCTPPLPNLHTYTHPSPPHPKPNQLYTHQTHKISPTNHFLACAFAFSASAAKSYSRSAPPSPSPFFFSSALAPSLMTCWLVYIVVFIIRSSRMERWVETERHTGVR